MTKKSSSGPMHVSNKLIMCRFLVTSLKSKREDFSRRDMLGYNNEEDDAKGLSLTTIPGYKK